MFIAAGITSRKKQLCININFISHFRGVWYLCSGSQPFAPPSPESYSIYIIRLIRGQFENSKREKLYFICIHCLGATKGVYTEDSLYMPLVLQNEIIIRRKNYKRGKLNTCYDCLSVFLAFLFAIHSLRVSAISVIDQSGPPGSRSCSAAGVGRGRDREY